jgi:hypothetical protein
MNNHGMPHNSNPLGSDTVVTPQLAVSPTNGFYAHEKGLGSIENACRIFDIARSPMGPRLSHQPKAVRQFSCLAYWHHIMKTKETVYINIYQNELKSFKRVFVGIKNNSVEYKNESANAHYKLGHRTSIFLGFKSVHRTTILQSS